MKLLQSQVLQWMQSIFPEKLFRNREQRCLRFLEESLELVQAFDLPKEKAVEVLEYVYSRPEGKPFQEVGGVMITLAALCATENLDADEEAFEEYRRIMDPDVMKMIKDKQRSKPIAIGGETHTELPASCR